GNGGLDVVIQRSYNTKRTGVWTYGFAGWPHYAYSVNGPNDPGPRPQTPPSPDVPNLSISYPRFFTADGAVHQSYPDTEPQWNQPAPDLYITADFWRYHADERRLELPNGVECFYDQNGFLILVRDSFQ